MLIPRVVVLFALVSTSSAALAQDADQPRKTQAGEADAATRAVARELGLEGIELYKKGEYATALDKLTRAHELVGLTTTGLWRARCLVQLGRLVEGSEALFEVTRMALPEDAKAVHVDAQRKAEEERKAVQARIPRLVIRVVGEIPDDTTILLDGQVLAPALLGVKQPVDPGKHVLEARGAGTSAEKAIELAEGEVLEIPVSLVDRDGKRSVHLDSGDAGEGGGTTMAIVGWVAVVLGAGGLVAGGVTGGLALSKKSTLDDECPDRACPPAFHEEVDSFETLRLASTISFIAGGVLAATGVTLVITGALTDGAGDEVSTRLRLSPSGLSLEGRF